VAFLPLATDDAGDDAAGMADSNRDLIRAIHVDEVEAFEVSAGITGRRLPRTDLVGGWLYDFEPGTEWPETDHHAAEERYYVTKGEIVDNGIVYPEGTYVVFAAGSSHRPTSPKGGQILGMSDARPSVVGT
jgi:quercetin dioxygenase-like cupin family protein